MRLEISQTPIREALSRLAQQGFVTRLSNRGYRVSEMTAQEVEELFGLRGAIEAYCLDEAIRRIKPEGIKALEQRVKTSRKAIVANDPLVDRHIINKDFHVTLAEIAGNSAVTRTTLARNLCSSGGLREFHMAASRYCAATGRFFRRSSARIAGKRRRS